MSGSTSGAQNPNKKGELTPDVGTRFDGGLTLKVAIETCEELHAAWSQFLERVIRSRGDPRVLDLSREDDRKLLKMFQGTVDLLAVYTLAFKSMDSNGEGKV